MKKIIFSSVLLGSLLFLLPACSKFTEITPKGSNILDRVSDLDLLLNFDYSLNTNVRDTSLAYKTTAGAAFKSNSDAGVLVNDVYPYVTNVTNLIALHSITLAYALTTYDETVDRKTLAASDVKYEKLYFIINNVCNVVLAKADQASGDRTKAAQLKAEAYILRAYFHYLLVNFYAKAYNPATAATDGGIPYVKEDNLINVPNKKSTVAEVYANIVADINAGLALNSLPAVPANNMRTGLGFAYAVKAQVLLAMRNYTGALTAANASLAINSTVIDDKLYKPVGGVLFTKPTLTSPENLFYASDGGTPVLNAPSLEVMKYYEPGNVINDYVKPYFPSVVQAFTITGVTGAKLFFVTTTYAVNTAGLTTSDTYLIKAECLARTQDVAGAMGIINAIRKKRIVNSVDLTATTEAQAMGYLMKLSRIEFLYTFKNYFNIKRWNTEDAYKQTITRTVNGVTYQLKPESPLWIYPFPQSGTNYNPNLTQNY
ncbi:MAG: SusD family protein [Mucilaginibacter sp.]|nr:SusD family protein [Mucilaginibacter sp.]